jgi:hypothetical protein
VKRDFAYKFVAVGNLILTASTERDFDEEVVALPNSALACSNETLDTRIARAMAVFSVSLRQHPRSGLD